MTKVKTVNKSLETQKLMYDSQSFSLIKEAGLFTGDNCPQTDLIDFSYEN